MADDEFILWSRCCSTAMGASGSAKAMSDSGLWRYRNFLLIWASFILMAVFLPKEFTEIPFIKSILTYAENHLWFIGAWVKKSNFKDVSTFCYLYLMVLTPYAVKEYLFPAVTDYRVLAGYWNWRELTIKRVFLIIISCLFTLAIGLGASVTPFEKIASLDISGSRVQFGVGAFILYFGSLSYGAVAPGSFIYRLFYLMFRGVVGDEE